MSDGTLKFSLQRRAVGAPTLQLVRFKRHGAVSVVLDPAEMDAAERAIAEAKRLIAEQSNSATFEVVELREPTHA